MRYLILAFIFSILIVGCEMPISTWNVNDTVDDVISDGEIICRQDGFDEICFVPQPYEVIIEVPVEKIVETEKIVEVEVPGETKVITVYTEVEVPVDPIVEVVTEYIEVPVEVIKIVEVEVPGEPVYIEVPVEVPGATVYVDREVIKIVEVEVEKIVKVPVEVKVVEYVEVEKEVEVIKEVEKIVYKDRVVEVIREVCPEGTASFIVYAYPFVGGWELSVEYPTMAIGQDYLDNHPNSPDLTVTSPQGSAVFVSYQSGGGRPVCAHFEILTTSEEIDVKVTGTFDGVAYKSIGRYR